VSHRIGIIGLMHESNTFIAAQTTLVDFENDLLLRGPSVREKMADSLHEVGGFFAGLQMAGMEAVPIFMARALPYGTISAETADILFERLLDAVAEHGPLDGYLVAPHGATVSANHADFDGDWLTLLRERIGRQTPMIATLDLHANMSARMVAAFDAIVGYRTNPHLDQKERGIEAALLIARTVRGEIRPTVAAAFPPLAANIERQASSEPHWRPLQDKQAAQLTLPGVLSNSLLYGFPYSDVPQMGSSVVVVTDNDPALAQKLADELAAEWWQRRDDFAGKMRSVADAMAFVKTHDGPVCLLDMGDNVGGGSPGDSTILAHALLEAGIKSLVILYDPESVHHAESLGVGHRVTLRMGGKCDRLHGEPIEAIVEVISLHDGKFEETEVRHGGIRSFDQGRTAIVVTDSGLTVMLTTRRTAPFSLRQLTAFGVEPERFHAIVAKGVHAPTAAYAPISKHFIRVNTPGATTADMVALNYQHRRKPLYPFE